ncbi:MAG: disulfide bond formation protein DsbA, partial [Bowdeniella nasicola]|nr:disulfide bond formation protein DsbA [Bowdeniella nasicola]
MDITFYFDPSCPWAWMTSRWMSEVIAVRNLDVKWRILSLGVLNEGRDLQEDYRAHIDETWGPARVISAAAEECGTQYIKPLYDEIG